MSMQMSFKHTFKSTGDWLVTLLTTVSADRVLRDTWLSAAAMLSVMMPSEWASGVLTMLQWRGRSLVSIKTLEKDWNNWRKGRTATEFENSGMRWYQWKQLIGNDDI